MNIRPKTVRRLAILFAGFIVLAGCIALLLVRSIHKERATVARRRETAFQAYAHRDNAAAVQLFGSYLNTGPSESSDADAIFAYGMARSQVPMDGNRHIAEAINLLQKYLDLAPSDPHDASHQLLSLYSRARYNKEASTLAARLLAKNPKDLDALRAKAAALISERDFAGALAVCQTLNGIDPTDVVWQDRQLQLMAELHQPSDQIIAHARKLVDAHSDDPRFHLVLAGALVLASDPSKANQEVEAAAKLPPPDALTALRIVAMLARGAHPDLADDLLARAQSKFQDPALEEFSGRRLFEREQYAELVDRLKALNPKSPTVSANLLAYDAIAQYQTGGRAQADAIVAALAARSDAASSAWTRALRAHFAQPTIEPAAAIRAYQESIVQDRTNAVFPYYLAESRAELGETDEAIRDWNTAARLSPFWAAPLDRISRTLSAAGRYAEALIAADALIRRAPGALETQIAYAIAAWERIRFNPAELHGIEGEKLLKNFERIRARAPREPQTLPAYAALLTRRGQRDEAIQIVRSAIHGPTPLPEATFEQLLPVSQQEHWGIESEILDAAEIAHGLTPSIAYDRVLLLFHAGRQTEALQLADSYRAAHPTDVVWQLDDARFRDAAGQPGGVSRWKALSEAHPGDVRVQYAALFAPCRFSDRDFWKRTIDRVKALVGPDGQAWQIEQARLTLASDPSARQLGPVIETLQKLAAASPELGEIRHLLAQALLLENKPDDLAKASAELTTAHAAQPANFQITSELTSLLIAQGQRDRAAALVNSVSREPDLDEARRVWAAQTQGQLGNFDDAIKLLVADDASAHADRIPLLASLYLRAGRMKDARSLCEKISRDPNSTPLELQSAADFFAAGHDSESTERCMNRLKSMNLEPQSAALLESHLQEVEGNSQAAAKVLSDACKANSHDGRLWAAWSGLVLRTGKLANADKIAANGLAAISGDPMLLAMRDRITQLKAIEPGDASKLLDPVSRDPRQPILEPLLSRLTEAKSQSQSPQQTASALRPLAEQYPRFFPLQQIVANRYLAAHDAKQAADLAARTADMLPGDPQPLKLLTEVQTAQRNWDDARTAALRWRESTLVNPLEADLALAQIDLQQPGPDPAAAEARLKPYVQDAAPQSQRFVAAPLYCRALLSLGRAEEAAKLFKPLVTNSPQWARMGLDLTSSAKDSETASQWLKTLSPLIPTNSQVEQIALADAWERIGTRFDLLAAHNAARDILRPIVGEQNVPTAAWRVWALANQLAGDLPEAERAWQKLLEAEPKDPNNRNNLAYVLLLEGEPQKLPRAESLAHEAIAADPNAPTFYDTLARIEARLGRTADSVAHFRMALAKDPNDVEAMVGLADELRSQPSGRDEARLLLSRINAKLDAGVPLMEPIRKQLERVKTALSAAINPGE